MPDMVIAGRLFWGTSMIDFDYSTAGLSTVQTRDYWSEMVCRELIPATAEFAEPEFDGHLHGHSFGSLVVCRMSARPHTFLRTSQHLRLSSDEDFVVAMVQSGSVAMKQCGREVLARPGDVVLYDAARPFVHALSTVSILLVRIPRQQLLMRFGAAESMIAVRIAEGKSMAGLLHGMAEQALSLPRSGPALQVAEARFAGAFVDMLAAAMEMQGEGVPAKEASRYDALYDRAVRYIDAHFGDGELDSNTIADALHVSDRTLSRAFAKQGTTVMQGLWKRRLDQSYLAIKEGRVHQVTQAAYQCGFNDLSHFSRAFRNTFGITPTSLLRRDA
jgi:AraC-like DNA-binding protein